MYVCVCVLYLPPALSNSACCGVANCWQIYALPMSLPLGLQGQAGQAGKGDNTALRTACANEFCLCATLAALPLCVT